MKFSFTSVEHVAETGAYWQRQLRLQDWDIYYRMRRHFEMPTTMSEAGAKVYPKLKQAFIYMVEPDDHEYQDEYDMEQSLVHELLHIPFDAWMNNDKRSAVHAAQEAFIDQMAATLVMLNRGVRR